MFGALRDKDGEREEETVEGGGEEKTLQSFYRLSDRTQPAQSYIASETKENSFLSMARWQNNTQRQLLQESKIHFNANKYTERQTSSVSSRPLSVTLNIQKEEKIILLQ